MTVSMGLAMVVAGVTVASVAELKRATAEFAKTRAEYALGEAQQRAIVTLLRNSATGRLGWTEDTELGQARVLAEPEYAKASFAKAADVDNKVFERIGVRDPDELKARLNQSPPPTGDQAWIAGLDPARLWRACAPSAISRYGHGDSLAVGKSASPDGQGFSWRPGEVWRVKASLQGWVDDRIVRLTGDDLDPAMTIERRFLRTEGEGQCEGVFSQGV